jgi:flagellar protein FlgJ
VGGGLAYGQPPAEPNRIAGTQPTPNPSLSGRGVAVGSTTSDTSRLASKDNLAKAGEQFESVFTGMMLKSMRQAKLSDPLFDSKALDTFRDMQDQMTVKAMAEHTPLGIGKAMTEFLAKGAGTQEPVVNQPPSSAAP